MKHCPPFQIVNGTYYYYTKGDNNPARDYMERTYDEIIGVVVGKVPAVGHVSLFLRTTEGFSVIFILFIVILVVPEFVCKDDEEEEAIESEATPRNDGNS